METQDGGDAKVDISPRDIVYMQSAEPVDGEEPEVLHKLDLRYGYVFKAFVICLSHYKITIFNLAGHRLRTFHIPCQTTEIYTIFASPIN